ncbi:MAG: hypothetical protein N2483_06975 [Burkholderiaceae bacterium]|nr:hypothetical protein [Burkholderiaceae bacterium]
MERSAMTFRPSARLGALAVAAYVLSVASSAAANPLQVERDKRPAGREAAPAAGSAAAAPAGRMAALGHLAEVASSAMAAARQPEPVQAANEKAVAHSGGAQRRVGLRGLPESVSAPTATEATDTTSMVRNRSDALREREPRTGQRGRVASSADAGWARGPASADKEKGPLPVITDAASPALAGKAFARDPATGASAYFSREGGRYEASRPKLDADGGRYRYADGMSVDARDPHGETGKVNDKGEIEFSSGRRRSYDASTGTYTERAPNGSVTVVDSRTGAVAVFCPTGCRPQHEQGGQKDGDKSSGTSAQADAQPPKEDKPAADKAGHRSKDETDKNAQAAKDDEDKKDSKGSSKDAGGKDKLTPGEGGSAGPLTARPNLGRGGDGPSKEGDHRRERTRPCGSTGQPGRGTEDSCASSNGRIVAVAEPRTQQEQRADPWMQASRVDSGSRGWRSPRDAVVNPARGEAAAASDRRLRVPREAVVNPAGGT